jgi:glycosyltransferase involved in cell wall biosynthesis
MADRDDVVLVHVTAFNQLMWHNGHARTVVIGHGIPDPGHRYTGELERAAVVVNEPLRRGRVTGTDLIPRFARVTPVDAFGIGVGGLPQALGVPTDRVRGLGDLGLDALHDELARRRVYLHLARWTSLGLSLLEAMHLGMPVVALASTEAVTAVPPEAGVVHTDLDVLLAGLRRLVDDPDLAAATGRAARAHALEHFGLKQFLEAWDDLLVTVTR